MSAAPSLTIVVAVTDVRAERAESPNGPAWLAALIREARSVGAEILLAGALQPHEQTWLALAQSAHVPLRVLATRDEALAPVLWGYGLMASERPVVAFTINQCVVQQGWARALLDGLDGADVGVGGRMELGADASRTARAIYFLRYSAFLATDDRTRRQVNDIAGDNAAYRRDALMQYGTYAHGFWEIEPHHNMRSAGATLAMIPGMTAIFGGSPQLATFVRQRFAHGRHFGAWRVRLGGRRPWQMALVAPLVPVAFFMRTLRRVRGHRGKTSALLGASGPFLALAAAWAGGEVSGAFSPQAHDSGSR